MMNVRNGLFKISCMPGHSERLPLKCYNRTLQSNMYKLNINTLFFKALKPSFFILIFGSLILSCKYSNNGKDSDWPEYLGSLNRNIYAPLDQIDTSNVYQLRPAWIYTSGDSGEMECNPLIINGILYGLTATKEAFALDAATGKEIWRFAPSEKKNILRNRGVTYWRSGEDERIFTTYMEWLYALDARTGQPISSFGDAGRVSLKAGLGPDATEKYVTSRTPGTIYENLIIMPLALTESAGAAPGYIQAFDVRTGKLVWKFRTIPHPGEYGYDTWPESAYKDGIVGGANSWAGMALDQNRGILFAPTGSAAPDFFGGNRPGENLFANSLLALNAKNGERIWHYQFIHHDIWDRDLPAPPALSTIFHKGQKIDVVTQTTKTGHLYIFDRETGESLYPIEEFEVPASEIPEESAWPVQRLPTWPAPFSRQTLTEEDINPWSPEKDSLLEVFRSAHNGPFIPLSETPTILFPGCDGGAEWGGTAVDPEGNLYVNSNEMAWIFTISRNQKEKTGQKIQLGKKLYEDNCSVCHQKDLSGNPQSGYPSLKDVSQRMNIDEIASIIEIGRGRMTGFPKLNEKEKEALINFLQGKESPEITVAAPENAVVPWKFDGYKKFLDSKGNPGISPPWGLLTSIDLKTGKQRWQRVLGELDSYTKRGIPPTGTENYGGPLATAGGLLFIAATMDRRFRAYNKNTGDLLWETELPFSGFATPATYMIDGIQYVVIACGGGKLGQPGGDAFVAFTL